MTKSKPSFAVKLFLTLVATNVVIIAVIAILVGQNIRSGFSRYLLEVELQHFDDLAVLVAESHDLHGSWDHLRNSPRIWHDLVRQSMGGPARPKPLAVDNRSMRPDFRHSANGAETFSRPPPPPRPLPRHQQRGGNPRPAPDPLRLGDRLSLIDMQGTVIAGRTVKDGISARLAVFARTDQEKDQGQDDLAFDVDWSGAQPIGHIILSAPKGNAGLRDSDFLFDQFRNLLFASLLALGLSALAAFFLARGVQRPIKILMRGTRKVARGEYDARMQEDRTDEFGQLIAHFNAMASSLEDAERAERQWLSDASHELKTPLAVLRGRIEGIQDGIYHPDKALMAEMHQTVERLTILVSDLNLLAHAREGQLLIHPTEENLSDLVCDALDHAKGRLEEKGLRIKADLPTDMLLECDRIRIRQLLDNLVENARRYTDSPGMVCISVQQSYPKASCLHLVIEDSAPCPPENTLPHLFERFFRTDPSRDRRSGGSGLGLSICRAIILAHNGSIRAESSPLGGLKVTISIPARQTSQPQETRND